MKRLDHYWQSENGVSRALLPLSLLFRLLVWLRVMAYRYGFRRSQQLPAPVIIVGNISVGGTGKSPMVVWLAGYLCQLGYRPGIISRGYGGSAREWPLRVAPDSDPRMVGDEPVMIARRTGCPVWVGPDRPKTGNALLTASDCDLVIADDGLQHYALARDIEIAVIDGERSMGNGHLLPAGPLREPVSRLSRVDLLIANGASTLAEWQMRLQPGDLVNLSDPHQRIPLETWAGRHVHAVAGIGNPGRFFSTLQQAGLKVIEHPFPDHHPFVPGDIEQDDTLPAIMTEKDAVKCAAFARPHHWYLEVTAQPDRGFIQQLERQLGELRYGQKTA